MRAKLGTLILLVATLSALVFSTASGAEIVVDEAVNFPAEAKLYELNRDAAGNLIASDEWGFIWEINPLTGSYIYYDLVDLPSTDVHKDANGKYWFTDNANSVGYVDPAAPGGVKSVYWEYGAGSEVNYNFGALALDDSGGVWVADWFSSESSKIYQFKLGTANSAQFCPLLPVEPGDIYTTYALDLIKKQDGSLWYYNYFEDKIYRFNPIPNDGKYELTSWTTGIPAGSIEGRVLAFDGSGRLWIPGGEAGTIMSFDTNTKSLSTYVIPSGPYSVEGVTVFANQVWFADLNGSTGFMNPSQLPVTPSNPPPSEASILLEPVCGNSQTGIVSTLSPAVSGDLIFEPPSDITIDPSPPGWTLYTLTTDDHLFGINTAGGAIFITDRYAGSTSRLLRIRSPLDNHLYLPMVRK